MNISRLKEHIFDVIGAIHEVHHELGSGLNEYCYQEGLQEGSVKHVYFVAETKGSMSSLDLRGIEKGKIGCAKKLFDQLSTSQIKYGKVDSFDELMNAVNGE